MVFFARKSYEKIHDFGGPTPIFGNTQIFLKPWFLQDGSLVGIPFRMFSAMIFHRIPTRIGIVLKDLIENKDLG